MLLASLNTALFDKNPTTNKKNKKTNEKKPNNPKIDIRCASQVYRRFIKGFALIAQPLYALFKKGGAFEWSHACISAFNQLKDALMTALPLRA